LRLFAERGVDDRTRAVMVAVERASCRTGPPAFPAAPRSDEAEPAVEAGIAAGDGAVAALVVTPPE
jgi:hypothetical protein